MMNNEYLNVIFRSKKDAHNILVNRIEREKAFVCVVNHVSSFCPTHEWKREMIVSHFNYQPDLAYFHCTHMGLPATVFTNIFNLKLVGTLKGTFRFETDNESVWSLVCKCAALLIFLMKVWIHLLIFILFILLFFYM